MLTTKENVCPCCKATVALADVQLVGLPGITGRSAVAVDPAITAPVVPTP